MTADDHLVVAFVFKSLKAQIDRVDNPLADAFAQNWASGGRDRLRSKIDTAFQPKGHAVGANQVQLHANHQIVRLGADKGCVVQRWFGSSEQVPGVSHVDFRLDRAATGTATAGLSKPDRGFCHQAMNAGGGCCRRRCSARWMLALPRRWRKPQVDLLVFDRPPQAFDHCPAVVFLQTMRGEDVVPPSSFAVHADLDFPACQHLDEVGRSELAALIRVEDFRQAVTVQCAFSTACILDSVHLGQR